MYILVKLLKNLHTETQLNSFGYDHNKLISVHVTGKQVWVVLQRALNTVRKEPAQLVTALRIIEREERADVFALQVRLECV